MMGERTVVQEALFYEFGLERHVPADHLIRISVAIKSYVISTACATSATPHELFGLARSHTG
jgi:hypothetical protein